MPIPLLFIGIGAATGFLALENRLKQDLTKKRPTRQMKMQNASSKKRQKKIDFCRKIAERPLTT